mgnify:CR=1 FL=1
MLGRKVKFTLSDTEIEGTLEQQKEDEERGTIFLVDVVKVNGEEQNTKTVVTVTPDRINQYGSYIED